MSFMLKSSSRICFISSIASTKDPGLRNIAGSVALALVNIGVRSVVPVPYES